MTTISEIIRRLALQSTRTTVLRWCRTGQVKARQVRQEGQPLRVWIIEAGQDATLKRLDSRGKGRPSKSNVSRPMQKKSRETQNSG